ncbi:MAG: inositol monophosphatase family protein [Alphaproteobacteria bacterium]
MRPAIINVMDKAARRAGRDLSRDFGEVEQLQVSRKGAADFVTAADRRAEETVRYELEKARPAFGFLGEEGGTRSEGDGVHCWIVDPLDGTTNFLHGLPQFAISIALEERGQIVAGIVYHPLTDELFWAERGTGAYLNDARLRVSARQHMSEALIATGMPFLGHGDHDRYLATLRGVMGEVAGIRRYGSAALDLAYLAAGRFDGFWEFDLNIWDIAAGILIVREAGGFVSDIAGRDSMLVTGEVVAGNDRIHEKLRKCLREADPGPTPSAAAG